MSAKSKNEIVQARQIAEKARRGEARRAKDLAALVFQPYIILKGRPPTTKPSPTYPIPDWITEQDLRQKPKGFQSVWLMPARRLLPIWAFGPRRYRCLVCRLWLKPCRICSDPEYLTKEQINAGRLRAFTGTIRKPISVKGTKRRPKLPPSASPASNVPVNVFRAEPVSFLERVILMAKESPSAYQTWLRGLNERAAAGVAKIVSPERWARLRPGMIHEGCGGTIIGHVAALYCSLCVRNFEIRDDEAGVIAGEVRRLFNDVREDILVAELHAIRIKAGLRQTSHVGEDDLFSIGQEALFEIGSSEVDTKLAGYRTHFDRRVTYAMKNLKKAEHKWTLFAIHPEPGESGDEDDSFDQDAASNSIENFLSHRVEYVNYEQALIGLENGIDRWRSKKRHAAIIRAANRALDIREQAFLMQDADDVAQPEIAKKQGASLSTLEKKLRAARESVRAALATAGVHVGHYLARIDVDTESEPDGHVRLLPRCYLFDLPETKMTSRLSGARAEGTPCTGEPPTMYHGME